jgi:hypothetical protein
MEEMTVVDDHILGKAIVAWTGFGETSRPSRDDARVVALFGDELADAVLPKVRSLEDDFYASDARHVAPDLAEMGARASADFARIHPEIPEEAVRALAWCYTYDYK